jgi:hypothetical protein
VSCAATKIDHLVLTKIALAETERLTEMCVLLVEGVHGLCRCEVGAYVCLLGLKIIMRDIKTSASSRAEGECALSYFTTNVSMKILTCYFVRIVILLLGFVYSKSLNYTITLFQKFTCKIKTVKFTGA